MKQREYKLKQENRRKTLYTCLECWEAVNRDSARGMCNCETVHQTNSKTLVDRVHLNSVVPRQPLEKWSKTMMTDRMMREMQKQRRDERTRMNEVSRKGFTVVKAQPLRMLRAERRIQRVLEIGKIERGKKNRIRSREEQRKIEDGIGSGRLGLSGVESVLSGGREGHEKRLEVVETVSIGCASNSKRSGVEWRASRNTRSSWTRVNRAHDVVNRCAHHSPKSVINQHSESQTLKVL